MERDESIFVAGHKGMVGRAIVRALQAQGFSSIHWATKSQLDLLDQRAVRKFMEENRFDCVVISAARVGGIQFNISNPTRMGYENGMIMLNLLEACHRADVERVMFLGSSCIYPRGCSQPMNEDDLLTGPFEPTNEMYAIAKTFGLKMVEAYRSEFGRRWISCQPCNIYGPFDSFDLENSHFVSAIIRKMHEAKVAKKSTMECWGTGNARREILYVDDLAQAILFLLENHDGTFVNVGSGVDHSIREITELIAEVVGYDGDIVWQHDKPEGMPRKLLDTSRITALGWKPGVGLREGLTATYQWWINEGESDEVSPGLRLVG